MPVDLFFTDEYFLGKRVNPNRFLNQRRMLLAFYQQKDRMMYDDFKWLNELKMAGKTNYDENQTYDTLLLYSGQRCGKSYLLAGVGCYEAHLWLECDNPTVDIPRQRGKEPVAPGSPIGIVLLNTSQDKAYKNEYGEVKAFIEHSDYFKNRFNVDKNAKKMRIEFPNGLELVAGSTTARYARGFTNLFVGVSELAWLTETASATGGKEVLVGLTNSTSTLGARMVIATSPSTVNSEAHKLFIECKSGDRKRTLFFHLSTFEVDPTQKETDAFYVEYAKNKPEDYKRDFLAIVSEALEPYFTNHYLVDKCWVLGVPGRNEIPPLSCSMDTERQLTRKVIDYVLSDTYPVLKRVSYFMAGDPAEKNDAFGFCLGHISSDDKFIDVDLIGRFLPTRYADQEIDANEVKSVLTRICTKFQPTWIDDNWGFQETRQALKDSGIHMKQVTMDKLRYDTAKEAIYNGVVRSYYSPQLEKEIKGADLVNGRKVEYKRRAGEVGHGDMCDAFCNMTAEAYMQMTKGGGVFSVYLPWDRKGVNVR